VATADSSARAAGDLTEDSSKVLDGRPHGIPSKSQEEAADPPE
jgi:hypothetical protein